MPVNLFISYSSEDKELLRQLQKHLMSLQRRNLIDTWSKSEILPGADWKQHIEEQINKADIILLLISPDFIASDYYGSP